MTFKGWEYSNGIVLHGMEKVYTNTRTTSYLNYIKSYVDLYVQPNGSVTNLSNTLDKIQPAILCLFLYKETGLEKYKTAATNIKNYFLTGTTFKKTPDGGYWHKNNAQYTNIMMLDGIYMAHPFLAKYGKMFNDTQCLNTAIFQTLFIAGKTYNANTNLAKHAWDYSKTAAWCNPATGVSKEVWSRAMGWYMMGLVDILQYTPYDYPRRNELIDLLNNLCIGIKNTQDASTGLWYQVMDKQDSVGNYLESSGSGMFVYALKTAVDNEWIDTSYLDVCRKGWDGLKTKITTHTDGLPRINSFAPAMSVQNNYTAYVTTPYTPVNCPATGSFATQHPHGYCGVLMAATAMEFPITTYTFTGDGDWDNSGNWLNNLIPPNPLPAGSGIIIDPIENGNCILNISQQISPGATIKVLRNKTMFVEGFLQVQ